MRSNGGGGDSALSAVAALAGRRIDAPSADSSRFPHEESEHVARKILRGFREEHVEHLVCSAACGADILALEVAEKLGISATLVLPYAPQAFRQSSVVDRPGDWGERFDRLVDAASHRGDLVELGLNAEGENAFSMVNDSIIRIASACSLRRKLAFVVWEGQSRGGDDSTADFLQKALAHGFEKRTVSTKNLAC